MTDCDRRVAGGGSAVFAIGQYLCAALCQQRSQAGQQAAITIIYDETTESKLKLSKRSLERHVRNLDRTSEWDIHVQHKIDRSCHKT